ncbi:YbaN family protein [Vagococcus vulneris]|uniref:DUF454 domain-containing protein n=1 Tax=Vagococcus vulneris TaxID=1977869 RepID=A0A429ZZ35_9ENTE|nr:YbaN family protein [Vagococcus vulneris]RST99277.1 hypothetical protein CBF37_04725 [Vagococcus vulneris]
MKKIIFIVLATVTFILGTIGIILPLLPTVPFYLLTSFLLVRSSPRLHSRFTGTKWYRQYVNDLLIEKRMTKTQQIKALIFLFLILAIPFIIVPNLFMRICLITVFVAHCIFLPMYLNRKPVNSIVNKD